MLVKVVNLSTLHHCDESPQIPIIFSGEVLDDASIVFLTFRLGEIFLIPDEGNGVKLNAHELISKIF